MPPFKGGLLKRKNSDEEGNVADTTQTSEDATSESGEESELELDMSAPAIEPASDESSELEDSDDDDSEDGDESEDGDDESEDGQSEQSDDSQESGIGQTTGSSDADHDTSQDLLSASKKILNKNAASKVIITRSKSKGGKESGVEHSELTSSDEQSNAEQGSGKRLVKSKTKVKSKTQNKQADDVPDTALAQLTKQIAGTHVVEGRDEYSSGDTSDEEERRNTRGAVPAHWYDELDHVGYDLAGRRLLRPARRSAIDDFLKRCEDPDFWRTVRDPSTGQDVVLSAADLTLLLRLRAGLAPSAPQDEYEPWTEWFSSEVLAAPVRAFPEHKRSFLPSGSERAQVARLVHALRCGWRKTRRQLAAERANKKERKFYDLWGSETDPRAQRHPPAPRRAPPQHAESYNPPPEYLLDAKEMKEWNKLATTPWKRKYTFLPTVHSSLRTVPAYPRYTRERFLRCLDLYLAPRATRQRLLISASDLVPRLPSPRELQPFPTREALRYVGHRAAVRCLDFDPSGRYCASGSDDGTLKVWEVSTGRCLRTLDLSALCGDDAAGDTSSVLHCAWAAAGPGLLAAAVRRRLLLLAPLREDAAALFRDAPISTDGVDARTQATAQWQTVTAVEWALGVRASVTHSTDIVSLAWHARGDYLATGLAGPRGVTVHQVSRRRSQLPLSRAKGAVQCVLFHPHRPYLFVATQRVVRVYDLVAGSTLRTLRPGAQWISTLALHPAGDNLLVGSYDRKCMWFDLDLSSAPYQTLRLHGRAVRDIAFHTRYPLFATGGDDPYLVVSHGTVYNDLLQNPLIVPLKQLTGPAPVGDLCTLALRWHPAQPWLLTAGADGTLRLLA